MKNNRNVVIVVIAVVLAIAFILNPSSVYMLLGTVQSLAIIAFCVVGIIYMLKRL